MPNAKPDSRPDAKKGRSALTPKQQELYDTFNGMPHLVSVETDDYQRVLTDIALAAQALNLDVYRMTAPGGMWCLSQEPPTQVFGGSNNIQELLKQIERSLGGKTCALVIEDFGSYISKDKSFPATQFRLMVEGFHAAALSSGGQENVLVVLVDPQRVIPDNLKNATVPIDYRNPLRDELEDYLDSAIAEARLPGSKIRVNINTGSGDKARLVNAMTGLTLRGMQTAFNQALARTGEIGPALIPELMTERKRVFDSYAAGTNAQFLNPPDPFEVAGCLNFKAWARRVALIVQHPERRVPLPRGVLLVGPAGTAKTMLTAYLSCLTGLSRIMLSLGDLAGGAATIGSVNSAMRAVLAAAESCAPVIIVLDEVLKHVDSTENAKRGGGTVEYSRATATLQTWAETRGDFSGIVLFGTSNTKDLGSGLPEGFIDRFPVRFLTKAPSEEQRADIFRIELTRRGVDPAAFGIPALARETRDWVGRTIRDMLDDAQAIANAADEDLADRHVLQAIEETTTHTEDLGGFLFRSAEQEPAPAGVPALGSKRGGVHLVQPSLSVFKEA